MKEAGREKGGLKLLSAHATFWAMSQAGEFWWIPFGVYLILGVPAQLTWALWAFMSLLHGLRT